LPWEDLAPGPVGEYLEVIDYDPAAKCFYEPVNLDDPYLLAQDGLTPSEGTPQFHQQIAYAVAQLTIHNFERALGRLTLWSPGPPADPSQKYDDSYFLQRLRIYPHALREANAYYSPAKKALLLGYFAAAEGDPADHVPGGLVFSYLARHRRARFGEMLGIYVSCAVIVSATLGRRKLTLPLDRGRATLVVHPAFRKALQTVNRE
jgi:hypothetical protein